MAYAASAVSFMLENVSKPICFTGSMLPWERLDSDGRRNLAVALSVASAGIVNEVSIFFSTVLLRANRATKFDSVGLNAFRSPNYPPLATYGSNIAYSSNALLLSRPVAPIRLHPELDTGILVVRLVPSYTALLKPILSLSPTEGGISALVLELYGAGNGVQIRVCYVRTSNTNHELTHMHRMKPSKCSSLDARISSFASYLNAFAEVSTFMRTRLGAGF